jgi:hypothetical protein
MKRVPGGWVLVARVTYDDIYGVSHWTNLCTFQVGKDTAQNCPAHNDQGDYSRRNSSKIASWKAPG